MLKSAMPYPSSAVAVTMSMEMTPASQKMLR